MLNFASRSGKMFRAEENAKASARAGGDSDPDDSNNSFAGATLKISGSESISPEQDARQYQTQGIGGATSSVLSGSDGGAVGSISGASVPGNSRKTINLIKHRYLGQI